MNILVADDDLTSRIMVATLLAKDGYDVVQAANGLEALDLLRQSEKPMLAVLDWLMPGMDGIEVCRTLREQPHNTPHYIILLTIKSNRDDTILGLDAGADDFISKPFDAGVLRARLRVGQRIMQLQSSVNAKVVELQSALSAVRKLSGLLPICAKCKSVRDDKGYWKEVASYLAQHSEVEVTHGICPSCSKELYGDLDPYRAITPLPFPVPPKRRPQ